MAYTPPAGTDLEFTDTGATYTAPSGVAVEFVFGPAGVTGTVAAVLPITADVAGSVGAPVFAATVDAVLPFSADVQALLGSTGTVTAVLSLVAAVQARVPRYVLSGVVKDGDTLVDRRVRVYLRSTGALVAQGDTTGGAFSFAVGDQPDEYMILPVDLSANATDWAPPCANRVLSVLLTD